MNGEHAEFELLDGYALGTLSRADAERVRAHVASCERCRSELGELQSVADVMPFALAESAAPAALRERILARLDAPAARRPSGMSWLVAGLAAALALAVGGNIWLATLLRTHGGPIVAALASPPATASASPAPTAATASPRAGAFLPAKASTATKTPLATPTPLAAPSADVALEARVARLEADLASLQHNASQRNASEVAQITDLQGELAVARRNAASQSTAVPKPTPLVANATPQANPELVAALSTGHVFSVDGAIGSQAWHLTIVQPLAGKNALIYTRTPDAPAGETYRTWVVRDGKTYDAGELPPDSESTLEMPMPLQSGDVVAFSREPIGSGSLPTTPFLMQITIHT